MRQPNPDEQRGDPGTVAAATEWLLNLLAEVTVVPDEVVGPLLEARLAQLPGVASVRFHRDRRTALSACERCDVLEVGETCLGSLCWRVRNAEAFSACEPWLPALCVTLATLLHARCLRAQPHATGTAAAQRGETRFRDLFDNSPDPCWLIERGQFTDCNHAASAMLGYARREDILQHPSRLSPEFQPDGRSSFEKAEEMMQIAMREGVHRFEWQHRRADGSCFPAEVTLARIDMQDQPALYCVWRDITQRKQIERQAYELAFFDPLTNLPNRRLLHERLERAIATCAREGHHGALVYLDLDHFKVLNDTQGHAIGDRLLVEMAGRLATVVRHSDTVARMGGDEFVLLLQPLDRDRTRAARQAGRIGEHVLQALAQPCLLDAMPYQNSASLGITLFDGQLSDANEILKRADMAMYEAKAAGRDTLRFFDPAIQAGVAARAQLEADLRSAVAREEFLLHLQPQVDADGQCRAVEALLRWQHPRQGLLTPHQFITLAEESGLIAPIGHWVIGRACRLLGGWRAQPLLRRLHMAVNVSPRQFYQPAFVASVRGLLQEHRVDPSLLRLEITESMLLGNVERAIATMRELKTLGVSFALDDFGTGYSSLNYVKRLPIDQIKIDQSFVRDIHTDSNDAAICRAVIAMGRSLGMSTLAEGVETPQQWQFLMREGCDAGQGFLFAPPLAPEALGDWLQRRTH